MNVMTVTLYCALHWGILCSVKTGNYLLWERILQGFPHKPLYALRGCAYLWGWEGLQLHFQMCSSSLFAYLLHSFKTLSLGEVAIMPGKYFNAIIKVPESVATQKKKV